MATPERVDDAAERPLVAVHDGQSVSRMLARLDGVRKVGINEWEALCPSHDDVDPSLSIGVGEGDRVLLNCFAGCEWKSIVAATGMSPGDLFPTTVRSARPSARRPSTAGLGKPLAMYAYTDVIGTVLFHVGRHWHETKGKTFLTYHPDGRTKGFPANTPRVVYRLPAVTAAIAAGDPVYVVEGEKDADRLASMGLCATTVPFGATNWRAEYADAFLGACLRVIRDQDDAGKRFARDVARGTTGKALSVSIFDVATTDKGADISDHLDAGFDLDALVPVADELGGDAVCVQNRERDALHLPEELWSSRPYLEHIRAAARSRLVAPDAVLHAILARVAGLSHHALQIPAIVGTPAGLSFFAALVGGPSTGKSAAVALAAELLPASEGVWDRLPIGTGEGMVDCLFESVAVRDANGKTTRVKRQTKHNAIFAIDEVEQLTNISSRSGATLLPTLRSAWTGGVLGNTNADPERRRLVGPGSYTFGVTVNVQPELAKDLLAGMDAGTPQRFSWAMATDPAFDLRPAWPGPLAWSPPSPKQLEPHSTTAGPAERFECTYSPMIVEEVVSERIAITKGEAVPGRGEQHRTLMQLKVAGILALLDDNRLEVRDDDWHLARILVDTSVNVRGYVTEILTAMDRRKDDASLQRHVRRELHVEDSKEHRALASASRSVARAVRSHADRRLHDDQRGGCTRACCTTAIAGSHRKLVSVDDVIAVAVSNEWVVVDGVRLVPGAAKPA